MDPSRELPSAQKARNGGTQGGEAPWMRGAEPCRGLWMDRAWRLLASEGCMEMMMTTIGVEWEERLGVTFVFFF